MKKRAASQIAPPNEHQKWVAAVGGPKVVAARLGLSSRMIRMRAQEASFPAMWFKALQEMGIERNVPVRMAFFGWREGNENGEEDAA